MILGGAPDLWCTAHVHGTCARAAHGRGPWARRTGEVHTARAMGTCLKPRVFNTIWYLHLKHGESFRLCLYELFITFDLNSIQTLV